MDPYGSLDAQPGRGSPLWPFHCCPEDDLSQPGFWERQDQEINPLHCFNDEPTHGSQHHVSEDEPALQTSNNSPSHSRLGETCLTNAAVPLELGTSQLASYNCNQGNSSDAPYQVDPTTIPAALQRPNPYPHLQHDTNQGSTHKLVVDGFRQHSMSGNESAMPIFRSATEEAMIPTQPPDHGNPPSRVQFEASEVLRAQIDATVARPLPDPLSPEVGPNLPARAGTTRKARGGAGGVRKRSGGGSSASYRIDWEKWRRPLFELYIKQNFTAEQVEFEISLQGLKVS